MEQHVVGIALKTVLLQTFLDHAPDASALAERTRGGLHNMCTSCIALGVGSILGGIEAGGAKGTEARIRTNGELPLASASFHHPFFLQCLTPFGYAMQRFCVPKSCFSLPSQLPPSSNLQNIPKV